MANATIILAGGVGTRLWPASLRQNPKQLLKIGGGRSLIQRAIVLALAATPDGPVVIVTGRDHVRAITAHVAELEGAIPGVAGRIVYLPEPIGRNTAPAIALGVTYLASVLPQEATTLVLTADHVIDPPNLFSSDAAAACELASNGRLVCFGIKPDHPETGYGYIRAGSARGPGYDVDGFTEKPNRKTAEDYLAQGGYYWNAGMFCFSIQTFLAELGMHAEEVARIFSAAAGSIRTRETAGGARTGNADELAEMYEQLPRISIDYALMERSDRVAVVPASFAWNDVGSWDEVARVASGDGGDRPPVLEADASDNHVDSDVPVAICGVSGIHVIVRNGKVLVCMKGRSQLVKEIVEKAESAGLEELL